MNTTHSPTQACSNKATSAIIEKHFIDDKRKKTPDSFFSIGPKELKKLVEESKKGFILRGNCKYGPSDYEKDSLVFRRSIFVTKNIQIGENFSHSNLAVIRPGNGIQPKFLNKIDYKIVKPPTKLFSIVKDSPKIKNLLKTVGDELKYAFKSELVSPVAITLNVKSPKLLKPLKT